MADERDVDDRLHVTRFVFRWTISPTTKYVHLFLTTMINQKVILVSVVSFHFQVSFFKIEMKKNEELLIGATCAVNLSISSDKRYLWAGLARSGNYLAGVVRLSRLGGRPSKYNQKSQENRKTLNFFFSSAVENRKFSNIGGSPPLPHSRQPCLWVIHTGSQKRLGPRTTWASPQASVTCIYQKRTKWTEGE